MNGRLPSLIFSVTVICAGLLALSATYSAQAQTQNGIVEPASGDIVSGIVIVKGTAEHPSFLRYELAFYQESRPGNDWVVFAQGDQPVIDGTLAIWDTTVGGETNPVFPDGRYRLRLRVVRNDYNYDEFFVTDLLVANGSLTPSATPTLTTTVAAVGTPLPATLLAATLQAGAGVLPSLTPFPTPSPLATPDNAPLGPARADDNSGQGDDRGLLDQITSIETGRFGRAFWLGVGFASVIFFALALYLLMRNVLRWLRRSYRIRRYKHR